MKGTTTMNEATTTVARRLHKDTVSQAFLGLTNPPGKVHPVQREGRHAVAVGGSTPNTEAVIRLLNEALDTAVMSILRYKRCQRMTTQIRSRPVKALLRRHVTDAQSHADQLAERIVQLGGKALLPFERLLKRNHEEQLKEDSVAEMLRINLLAELSAIRNSQRLIASVGTDDPATREVLEQILAQEEAYAENLISLLRD